MHATNAQPRTPSRPFPALTVTVAFTALALFALGDGVQQALQYDASGILAGEWWRLTTQHLVHWNGSHLGWDVAAFLGLGVLCERLNRARFVACLAVAAPVLSLALLVGQPDLATCRGISGIDSALFALLIWQLPRRNGKRGYSLPLAATVLFLAKCGYEFFSGGTLFADTADGSYVVVPLVHMAGFLCGLGSAHIRAWPPARRELLAITCRA